MVLDGGTSETIEFDIMAVGVRSGTYRYDVFADVVEVWGAPPPDGYKRDVDSGNFTILPYYDFELDVCDAGFSYYSDNRRINLYCWVINLGNAEDKFDMTISQDSKDALIEYGFKFNPQASSSNDLIFGYTLVSVEDVFIFDGDTSKWRDNDTEYFLSEAVMVLKFKSVLMCCRQGKACNQLNRQDIAANKNEYLIISIEKESILTILQIVVICGESLIDGKIS